MISKRDIAVILIRVLSAYMLLQALSILPMSIRMVTANPVIFLISHEFTTFVISTALWFAAPRLSNIMVKDISSTHEPIESAANYQIEVLIVSAIGLILVVVSIPALANMVGYNRGIDTLSVDATIKAQMIATSKGLTAKYISNIFLGIILFFYSEKLCRFAAKVRNIK